MKATREREIEERWAGGTTSDHRSTVEQETDGRGFWPDRNLFKDGRGYVPRYVPYHPVALLKGYKNRATRQEPLASKGYVCSPGP